MSMPFALQLYTVRDHLDQDVPGTLARVKEMGFDHVESAGTAGLSVAAFRKCLDDAGLKAMAAHFGLDALADGAQEARDACAELGIEFAVMPYAKAEDKDGWVALGRTLDEAGAALREDGVQLCYHNHAHEFERFDGECAFDLIFSAAQPANLAAELDTFWVKHGGEDPAAYIRKYAGRCPLVHMKDMAASGEPIFADLGTGTMDWPPVLAAAAEAGARWLIAEQDLCKGDSLDSAAVAARFLASL